MRLSSVVQSSLHQFVRYALPYRFSNIRNRCVSFCGRGLMNKMVAWRDNYEFICKVLNLGGGFGIRYTEEDKPLKPSVYVEEMARLLLSMTRNNYPLPEIWIEPGRSLVGDAGTTLYTAGSSKEVPGIRKYVAVDGGMSDNIRPALYGAKYTAVSANRMNEPHEDKVTIAGKCCESGDKLIEEAYLQIQLKGTSLLFSVQGLMAIRWLVITIVFQNLQLYSVKMETSTCRPQGNL